MTFNKIINLNLKMNKIIITLDVGGKIFKCDKELLIKKIKIL